MFLFVVVKGYDIQYLVIFVINAAHNNCACCSL